MKPSDQLRIRELLQRLETLETTQPTPEEAPIVAVAQNAIVDELTRLTRQDWLAVYRKGNSLDAISMVG